MILIFKNNGRIFHGGCFYFAVRFPSHLQFFYLYYLLKTPVSPSLVTIRLRLRNRILSRLGVNFS